MYFPLSVFNVYLSLAVLKHKFCFNSKSSFYRQFHHQADVQLRSGLYWKHVPFLNKNKLPHGPADSQNLVWVNIRCVCACVCVCVCVSVWGCYVPHIWQFVTTASRKEEKRSRQEAMEYFHLGAYGTSTKPVVITMSTIAGVHFIGYTCFWRSLATELRVKLLQSSYLIWNSIMFCWEKETHPDCGLVTAWKHQKHVI